MDLGSRLNSPHPSVTLKNSSRKRALSHSPLDFGLDIENLTRSSESSLHLQSFGQASRTSSNASGSYGHLSASMSPELLPYSSCIQQHLRNTSHISVCNMIYVMIVYHVGSCGFVILVPMFHTS